MANIDTYLQQILAAIYGEDVRGSIHDAIQEINNVVQNWESGLMDTTLTSTTLPAQGKAVGDYIFAGRNTTGGLIRPIMYKNSSAISTLSDLPANSYTSANGAFFTSLFGTFPYTLVSGSTYVLYRFALANSTSNQFFLVRLSGLETYIGYGSASSITWKDVSYHDPVKIDETLTKSGEAADSKTVGDTFAAGRDTTGGLIRPIMYKNSSAISTLSDLPANSYTSANGAFFTSLFGTFPYTLASGTTYVLYRFALANSTSNQFFLVRLSGLETYIGYGSASSVTWMDVSYHEPVDVNKNLKILFLGNSYTQDCVVYAPFIVDGFNTKIKLTVGISYYSGASIDNYINFFDNDAYITTYSKYTSGSSGWVNTSSKKFKELIIDEDWDIIVFQQSSRMNGDWSTFSGLNSLITKVTGYYAENYQNKSLKLGWMMPQLFIGRPDITFEMIISCIKNVLDTTPIDFVIPCGTAIENARNTVLDSLGDYGHLTADDTGHLQEGLPVLLSSYVTALKLLELGGEKYHGILREHTRPTESWISARSIPGRNGTSTGVNDTNCYLAQKCAIAAVKSPEALLTIS